MLAGRGNVRIHQKVIFEMSFSEAMLWLDSMVQIVENIATIMFIPIYSRLEQDPSCSCWVIFSSALAVSAVQYSLVLVVGVEFHQCFFPFHRTAFSFMG
jgi:hypothetical protein